MIGATGKGNRFFYYGCQNYLKRGRTACDAGLMSRTFLEDCVIDNLRREVLTDKNLAALVHMVNEERGKARRSSRERVAEAEGQVSKTGDARRGRTDRLANLQRLAEDRTGSRLRRALGSAGRFA